MPEPDFPPQEAQNGVRGDRVRALRKARGWTQIELAVHAGIGQSAVSKIERGSKDVWVQTVVAIARVFGVSTDYLLGLSDNPDPR